MTAASFPASSPTWGCVTPKAAVEVTVEGGTESIRVSRDLSDRLYVGAP